jgi:hypothetical protein
LGSLHAGTPLAVNAGLSRIRNFDTGKLTPIGDNLLSIRRALDVAGVNARNPPNRDVHRRDRECPVYVDSSRPVSENSGRSTHQRQRRESTDNLASQR